MYPCHCDISLTTFLHDISLTTGLYAKYTLVNSFDLRCQSGILVKAWIRALYVKYSTKRVAEMPIKHEAKLSVQLV